MTTKWCPSCRTEYRDDISNCADCGSALVDELPPLPTRPREPRMSVEGPFSPDDDVVELTTTTAVEAEVTAAHLRSAGIPATVFRPGPYSGYGAAFQIAQGARIMVRRADAPRAAEFVQDLVGLPAGPKPRWVRGIAAFVLALFLIPVAAIFPPAIAVIVGVALVAALTLQHLRRRATQSERALGADIDGT